MIIFSYLMSILGCLTVIISANKCKITPKSPQEISSPSPVRKTGMSSDLFGEHPHPQRTVTEGWDAEFCFAGMTI